MTSPGELRALNLDDHERIQGALARGDSIRSRNGMRSQILHACAILIGYLAGLEFWQ